MIGIMFLAAAVIWLAISLYFSLKVPSWLGMTGLYKPLIVSALVLAVLLIGPFVDEIIGMRQFEKLCKERAIVQVSVNADQVHRAARANLPTVALQGYWVKIESQPVAYIDLDTGRTFLKYDILHTKGGKVAGLALLDGEHSCSPPAPNAMNDLDIDRLITQGKS